ncbi:MULTISPECIES: flagellin N-terminal helical domain-containing protein [Peribacillus]|uniref:flagellin N-terminal helical domain-containing protein n=1 Tax=Peribacillus TaxID=2675229 RepID=UPI001F4DA005|nr:MULTISPECIES: flagellin [unclassified Peribacillus]MCK1984981.1 flagellin [Peribacillus sp. Aquil_B1]MCK2009882.1 flagellin [Peribacillus sp. Aquil_B8]
MIINHNISALNTHRQLSSATNAQSKSMEKLASGMRINRAGDDAAGLAISEKMRGQIRGLDQASRNSQDAISLIQTAEGALNETTDILQRMRELATQASTDTNTTSDRGEIQKEMDSLTSEINRIGNTTEFNTQKLLNGSKDSATAAIAVGDELKPSVSSKVTVGDLTFTAKADGDAAGADGNDYSVEIVQGSGTSTASSVALSGNKITVTLGTDGSDDPLAVSADDIKALIEGNNDTKDLVSVTVAAGKNGAAQAVAGEKDFTGGAAAVLATEEVAAGSGLQFQIGANENQSLTLEIGDMRASALGLTGTGTGFTAGTNVSNGTDSTGVESGLDVSNAKNASAAITKIQTAIDKVSAERSKLGANQNRLEHTINNLGTSSENLTAAESRVRDTDMAKTMMEQTKNSILAQASQAMLAQANQQPQGVLQLLR